MSPSRTAVALGSHPRVVAVGVNCTAPRHLPGLLRTAGQATDKPLIAYPNGGDRWDGHTRRWVADEGGAYDANERRHVDDARGDLARWLLRHRPA